MVKLLSGDSRRVVASVVMLGSSLLLIASALIPAERAFARQEEQSAAVPAAATELRISSDISEENIEKVDSSLATSLTPKLTVLYDQKKPAAERLAAGEEIHRILSGFNAVSAQGAELKSRVQRRAGLLLSAIQASQVADLTTRGDTSSGALTSAAVNAHNWLRTVNHGDLWVGYLHLPELQSGSPSREVLQQVRQNLTVSSSIDTAQQQFIEKPLLQALKASVESTLAAMPTTEPAEESALRAELTAQLDRLVATSLAFETNQLAQDADRVRSEYRMLRSRFPAAAEVLRPQIMNHYFNHNLHFTLSESLLSRLISNYRSESGRIADCIMGAWVTGSQVTNVNVTADIEPSASSAHFRIIANGSIHSNTAAQKSPATIFSEGNHGFTILKPVYFSGREVSSDAGTIDVDVNSRTVGLRTKYDGIPLIGGIVRRMAWKKVAESAPRSRAITTERISDQALPKFEQQVSDQLSSASSTIQKTLNALDAEGVGPESISARSSSTHAAVSLRTMGSSRLGGSAQPPVLLSSTGLAIQLHESALNNTADALGLKGETVPEDEVISKLEKGLSELLQREIKFGREEESSGTSSKAPADTSAAGDAADGKPAEEKATSFAFSRTDPIRVHFTDNQAILVLRMGVLQQDSEPIPEQVVTIPVSLKVEAGKLIVEPGTIRVASVQETSRARQVTRANQIRRILERKIIRRELDATYNLQAAGDRTLPLTLTLIQTSDGWLTAEMQ